MVTEYEWPEGPDYLSPTEMIRSFQTLALTDYVVVLTVTGSDPVVLICFHMLPITMACVPETCIPNHDHEISTMRQMPQSLICAGTFKNKAPR